MSEINDTKEIPEGNFPINLKIIEQHQQKYPRLVAKYKEGAYHTSSFRGVSNIDINLIDCGDNIVINSIIQSCV